jgi:uncharacterized membrane protein YphA (DoxX/SURF4 family)
MLRSLPKYIPVVIGVLFLYTGILKLLYPSEAVGALESLEVPFWLANALVLAVTILELYLGVLLVLKVNLKHALIMAMGLMLIFTGYLWHLSMLAHPPSCGCLGLTGLFNSNKHNALFGLFRNCVILWGLKVAYDYYFKSPTVVEASRT